MKHWTYDEIKAYVIDRFPADMQAANYNLVKAERNFLFGLPHEFVDNPLHRLFVELALLLFEERNHLLTEEMRFELYYCDREVALGLFYPLLDKRTRHQVQNDLSYLKSKIPLNRKFEITKA